MKISRPQFNWQRYNFGSISLCMIMRNSAKNLSRCLDSVSGVVDDIVIVDTGSVDDSQRIAESYGARVYKQPWQDDFAKPRNLGLAHARSQWILIMDPDETISRSDHLNIKWLTRTRKFVSFWLTTFNYSPFSRDAKYKLLPNGKDPTGKFPGYVPSTKTRFFKNGLDIKFEGVYHELVDWCIVRRKLPMAQSTVPIHHWTHEIEQKSWQDKKLFYLRMGEKKVSQWPKSGKAWWELSITERSQGLYHRALHSIKKALEFGFIAKEQYFALADCYRAIGEKPMADYSFEKATCNLFPGLTHIDPNKKHIGSLTKPLYGERSLF